MRLTPGTVLGPYEISGAIGAGGMGEVYRARDTRLGREVALKVLPREVAGDAERLVRFEREARSASALNHPNIVTIHDFAFAENDCYLVMELIRGESLRQLLSRGAIPLNKLLGIAGGIADGLAAAHAAGIVHRDLKPENIMLTADGAAKILDFGLVKAAVAPDRDAATEVRATNSGMIVGTLAYMSPEQAQGESVGIASDQFSLGLMLHEMATGKQPFLRATPYETVTAIIREEPTPLGASFPEPFRWIVERCLAKEPAQRYASTSDLAHDLRALRGRLSASGAATTVTTAKLAAGGTIPSRRLTVAAAAAALVMAVLAIAVLWGRNGSAERSDPLHLHLATGELQTNFGETAVPISISPDGRRLVTQGRNRSGTGELWLTDLTTGDMRLIAQNGFGAAWSNDSTSIAFFADGKLKTIRAEGGPARIVCDAPPESTPSWYGDTIVFARYSGNPEQAGLYRVDAAGGVPKRLISLTVVKGQPHAAWWPHFLPGGKRFIYMTLIMTGEMRIEHQLNVGSLDGSPAIRLGAIDSRAVFAAGHLLYVRDGTLLAQPFDAESARFTGEARPLVDDLHYFRSTGMAAFTVSESGILAWRSARRPTRLVWLDRNGIETAAIATAHLDGYGRLSRDGKRYAAGVVDPKQGISDIWLYDLERESADRLTFDLLDEKAPVWAHGGESLYYRTDGNKGPPDIFMLRPGERPAPLHAGPSVEHPEDVSPDGKFLLFTSYLTGTSDIHLLPLDPPGKPRPYVATPMDEQSPRFSPDGRWVAYASNVSGRSEIYMRPFDGAAAGVRVSQAGGASPRWSGTGRELFFLGPAGRLFSAPVDATSGRTAGTPRMLFQASDALTFEVAPEGDRFLVQMQERSGQPDVQLIVNWPAVLAPADGSG